MAAPRPRRRVRAPALAALIATVADLHESGIAHGSLEAAHVLVGEKHRPILCGLGDGSTACDAGITDDRRALAALIDQLGTDDALLAQARADLEDPSVSLRAVVRRLDMQSSAPVSSNRRFPRLPPAVEPRHFALPAIAIAVRSSSSQVLSDSPVATDPSPHDSPTTDGTTDDDRSAGPTAIASCAGPRCSDHRSRGSPLRRRRGR
jgi:hypothetical protein